MNNLRAFILTGALLALLSSSAWAWGVLGMSGSAAPAGCSGSYGNTTQTEDGYDTLTNNLILVYKITVDCTDTPETINFRTKYLDGNVKFVIYSANGANPGSLLYASSPVDCGNTSSTTTISDSSCDYELSTGSYYVGVVADAPGRSYRSSTTGGDGFYATAAGYYANPPSSWPTETDTAITSNVMVWMAF